MHVVLEQLAGPRMGIKDCPLVKVYVCLVPLITEVQTQRWATPVAPALFVGASLFHTSSGDFQGVR